MHSSEMAIAKWIGHQVISRSAPMWRSPKTRYPNFRSCTSAYDHCASVRGRMRQRLGPISSKAKDKLISPVKYVVRSLMLGNPSGQCPLVRIAAEPVSDPTHRAGSPNGDAHPETRHSWLSDSSERRSFLRCSVGKRTVRPSARSSSAKSS